MAIKYINASEKEFLSTNMAYKYMGLRNAIQVLKDKSLWFANPTKWKDPFEKRFIEYKYQHSSVKKDFPWKDKVFYICLTEEPCEASWRMYSSGEIGIQFKIVKKELLKQLNIYQKNNPKDDIYIERVEYISTKDIERPLNKIPFKSSVATKINNNKLLDNNFKAQLLFIKRYAFKYENEIRIIIIKKEKKSQMEFPFYIHVKIQNFLKTLL